MEKDRKSPQPCYEQFPNEIAKYIWGRTFKLEAQTIIVDLMICTPP